MPCLLVILSLWRIAKTTVRRGTPADKLWVCVYAALNAFSALWSAKVLAALTDGPLSAELVRASFSVGLVMFILFMGALFLRELLAAVVNGASRVAKACRLARRKS